MNRRRRLRKHRKTMSADSKRGLFIALVWIGAALFAVLLALLLGNVLGNIAENVPQNGEKPPIYEYDGAKVEPVDARYFELNGHTESSINKVTAALPNNSDVAFILRSAGRAPSYRSAISYAISGTEGGLFDLTLFSEALKAKKVRAVGCFYSSFASSKNETVRSAVAEYEASLIAEAVAAGVKEVLIFGLPTDDEGVAYASTLFMDIRKKAPDAILGAAIGYKIFEADNAPYVIDTYSSFADFCAIDTSGALLSGTNAAGIAAPSLYYFERYSLRILIEDIGESDREAQKSALLKLGISDIQSMPVSAAAG